jgi:hypothetical protein
MTTCPGCEEEIPGELSETYGLCDHCVGRLEEIERGGPHQFSTYPKIDRPALNEEPATRFAE